MKKIIALLLSLILIFTFAACSGEESSRDDDKKENDKKFGDLLDDSDDLFGDESNDVSNKNTVDSYADAYNFYSYMIDVMSDTVTNIVDENNARLEEEEPDTYYQSPEYYLIVYMPFYSLDMALTATISEESTTSSIEMAYSFLGAEDVEFEVSSPGEYRLAYKITDDETGEVKNYEELMRYSDGSMRYEQIVDGETNEFSEYVSLGNDRYALQNKTNRAIVTYKDGVITELFHSLNIYDTDWETGEVVEGSFAYDPIEDSVWDADDLDIDWVLEYEDDLVLERIYDLSDSTLTISGQESVYDWETDVTSYEPMEPIVIEVK